MKAYKLTQDYKDSYGKVDKNRLFVKVGSEVILLATPTLETNFIGNYWFNKLNTQGLLKEVNLEDERWVHPHLHKNVRKIFEEYLASK